MEENNSGASRTLFAIRLAIGLVQATVLYFLWEAYDAKTWPATQGLVFAPLLLVFLFVPFVVLQGLGNLRTRTLLIWAGAAALLILLLALYDIWRSWPVDWDYSLHATATDLSKTPPTQDQGGWRPHVIPSWRLLLSLSFGLFIAHALVAGGDADRRFIASYKTHFDVAWKQSVQLVLSLAFTGVFWAALFLGASLFELIKLDFFRKLIEERWFWIPVTAMVFSAAVHITDMRIGLVRGARTLGLLLLSWLLPVLTLIVIAFLVALAFTGLAPLWATGHAGALLLISAGGLVLLVNAAYHDGTPEHLPVIILRLAGRVAAILLTPLVCLAIYALYLRINQYGWSPDRIDAVGCTLIAAFYAGGYALAAIRPGPWLKHIELWNFYSALVVLVILLVLLSPLADPARISVNDQLGRLENGTTKPENFDYNFLRWDGGRFGKAALERIASSNEKSVSQSRAKKILDERTRAYFSRNRSATPADRRANMTLSPAGTVLPDSFINQDWGTETTNDWTEQYPACLTEPNRKCTAAMFDVNGDGKKEILLADSRSIRGFKSVDNDKWRLIGMWHASIHCFVNFSNKPLDGLTAAPPELQAWPDLQFMGKRLRFADQKPDECPKVAPAP